MNTGKKFLNNHVLQLYGRKGREKQHWQSIS